MELVYLWIFITVCHKALAVGISPKLDFSDDTVRISSNTSEVRNAGEDIEVKHTIVVSTKLKNSGLHSSADEDDVHLFRPLTRKQSNKRSRNDDSGEVPVVNGYLALESTQIKTPDTRTKPKIYPDSVFVNYNINRDGNDVYPDNAADPRHWKPSTFYNNINWKSSEFDHIETYNLPSSNYLGRRRQKPGFNRRISQEGLKEYYCCKCKEFQESRTSVRPSLYPWHYETTTKIKLDGKLAKLD